MRAAINSVRVHALEVAILLMVAAIGLTAYALIQVSDNRSAAILRECNAQNQRHAATVRSLDNLITKAEKREPRRAKQIAESKGSTLLLIDDLAPYQNCQRVLAKST